MGGIGKFFEDKDIVMYSHPECGDCKEAKTFFERKGIPLDIRNIDDEDVKEEVEKKYGNVVTPIIIINGKTFVGFRHNIEKIKNILKHRSL